MSVLTEKSSAPGQTVEPVTLEIKKLNGRIGAIISNIKLSGDLSDGEITAIRQALIQHKVIFFRNQQHLDGATQEAFSKRFGPLQGHPFAQYGKVMEPGAYALTMDFATADRTNTWHTDMTFLDAYPMASVLFGDVIPEFGGNTMWSNTAAAYEHLPPALKALADTMWAVHSNSYDYASERLEGATERTIKNVQASGVLEATHPVVRVHPESGERCLLLGAFVSHLKGYGIADSQALYDLYMRHMTKAENTMRWTWQQGDVAMWDNRSTLHYGVMDFGEQRRILRRVTIAGDTPVSTDGQSSSMTMKPARGAL